jgi:hypothetical protein
MAADWPLRRSLEKRNQTQASETELNSAITRILAANTTPAASLSNLLLNAHIPAHQNSRMAEQSAEKTKQRSIRKNAMIQAMPSTGDTVALSNDQKKKRVGEIQRKTLKLTCKLNLTHNYVL